MRVRRPSRLVLLASRKRRACSQAAINIVRRIKCVSPKRQETRIRKYFSNYEFPYSYVVCIHVLCIFSIREQYYLTQLV